MYQPINPIEGRPGYFGAFLTASDEAIRAEMKLCLVEATRGTECPTCEGWGTLPREAVGCPTCHGRGVVNE